MDDAGIINQDINPAEALGNIGLPALPVLLLMATAVVHLYSTALYLGEEILAGLPHVNTASVIDTWIKFGLANAPWLVFPWFVLYWGARRLA